jgi:type IV secretion system protein VirB9
VAVLYNDAYQTPSLDAGSPRPRPEAAAEAASRDPFGRRRTTR